MSGQDIDFLEVAPRTLVIDGRSVTVAPIQVRNLPALVRTVEPLLAQIIYTGDSMDPVQLAGMIGLHGDAVIEAVALCTGEPVDFIGSLQVDRMIALTMLVVEVNGDFFTRAAQAAKAQAKNIAPTLLQKLMDRLETPAEAGPAPSTS